MWKLCLVVVVASGAIHPDQITDEYIEAGRALIHDDSRQLATPPEALDAAFYAHGQRLVNEDDEPLVCPESVQVTACTLSGLRSALGAQGHFACRNLPIFTDEYVTDLCDKAKIATDLETGPVRLESLLSQDSQWIEVFYDGGTEWNEYTQLNDRTYSLAEAAAVIPTAYEAYVTSTKVLWPFQYQFHEDGRDFSLGETDVPDTPQSCAVSAAMCCWTRDRQAGDGAGNCRTPYETQCINRDPGDNTDVCRHDLARSTDSNHLTGGFLEFPDDVEGAVHCHGITWNPNDAASDDYRFAGNTLYYVSLYDHLYNRGYVENVPGAPMCGCVEKMPQVSRADCEQVDLKETWHIGFRLDQIYRIRRLEIDLSFGACRAAASNNLYERYIYPTIGGASEDIKPYLTEACDNVSEQEA